jgi:glutamate/tyrosine decarboxylase-like PLP-dependent enzyme
MDLDRVQRMLSRLPSGLAATLHRGLKKLPPVARRMEREYDEVLGSMMEDLRPEGLPATTRLPERGRGRNEILDLLRSAMAAEEGRWTEGFASGAVYHGDPDHVGFLNAAYGLHSQSNPLHADLWPSTVRFEADIVSMTAHMLNGPDTVGTVTSGGTESILLAMKAYRDHARADRNIARPEMVIPVTAHAAFDKAAEYFGLVPVRVPVDEGFRADVAAIRKAVTRHTAVVVGSAPSFAHGVVDPIPDIAAVAAEGNIGMHVDACLGGFLLPWAERLGHDVSPFDFRVEGVTSMSADTHKYGFAAKGTSVVLYRDRALRRHQYFTATDWPGGLYVSPTLAGSRPGGLSAACWAAMVATGERGYLDATRRILETAAAIKSGIGAIDGLRILGDPLWVIAFTSDHADIYRIMESMTARGWSLNGLQRPPAVHLAVTLRHTIDGVAERFLADLAEAAAEAADPSASERGAPLYGMAASFPVRGVVDDLLERYLDHLYDA